MAPWNGPNDKKEEINASKTSKFAKRAKLIQKAQFVAAAAVCVVETDETAPRNLDTVGRERHCKDETRSQLDCTWTDTLNTHNHEKTSAAVQTCRPRHA